MIRVTRIVGESYDLETGQKLSNGIILSNGISEFMLTVGDDVIVRLLEMKKESTDATRSPTHLPSPRVVRDFSETSILEDVSVEGVVRRTFVPEELEEPEFGEVNVTDDYSDSGTGVASL